MRPALRWDAAGAKLDRAPNTTPDGLFNSYGKNLRPAICTWPRNDDADTPFGKFFSQTRWRCHSMSWWRSPPEICCVFDDAASIVDEGYQQHRERRCGLRLSQHAEPRTEHAQSPRDGHGGSARQRHPATSWHLRAHLSRVEGFFATGEPRGRLSGRAALRRPLVDDQRVHRLDETGCRIGYLPGLGIAGSPDDSDDTVSIARLGSADAPVDAGAGSSGPIDAGRVRDGHGFLMGDRASRRAPEVVSKAVRPIASKLIEVLPGPPRVIRRCIKCRTTWRFWRTCGKLR